MSKHLQGLPYAYLIYKIQSSLNGTQVPPKYDPWIATVSSSATITHIHLMVQPPQRLLGTLSHVLHCSCSHLHPVLILTFQVLAQRACYSCNLSYRLLYIIATCMHVSLTEWEVLESRGLPFMYACPKFWIRLFSYMVTKRET